MIDQKLSILRFWRDLEIFQIPEAPKPRDAGGNLSVTKILVGKPLPWLQNSSDTPDDLHTIHAVYLGALPRQKLFSSIHSALFPRQEVPESGEAPLTGTGWLAAFVIDEKGCPVQDSYVLASFLQGVSYLRDGYDLSGLRAALQAAKEAFAQRIERYLPIESPAPEKKPQGESAANPPPATPASPKTPISAPPFTWEPLLIEQQLVLSELGISSEQWQDIPVLVRSLRNVQSRFLDDAKAHAIDHLNSFFLDDLDLILDVSRGASLPTTLDQFLSPPIPDSERIDILQNHHAMTERVAPDHLPLGRWPAPIEHSLVLAQQAAVFEAHRSLADRNGLMGINGPPGTGKTTLLCDIIADVLVDRAYRLTQMDQHWHIWQSPQLLLNGLKWYPIVPEIMEGTSIVVSSSNNQAVQNISQELPARQKIASQFAGADYFAEVMDSVFASQNVRGEDGKPVESWGLIAAALGNFQNRRQFAKGFFRYDRANPKGTGENPPLSMKQILDAASAEQPHWVERWNTVRDDFRRLYDEATAIRSRMVAAHEASPFAIQARLQEIGIQYRAAQKALAQAKAELSQAYERRQSAQTFLEHTEKILEQYPKPKAPGIFDRFRKSSSHDSLEAQAIEKQRAQAVEQYSQATQQWQQSESAWALKNIHYTDQKLACLRLQEQMETYQKQATQSSAALSTSGTLPDADFWSQPFEHRHRSSLWVDTEWERLRSELFLRAMDLHRSTILANAGRFAANLRHFSSLLTGMDSTAFADEHRRGLWQAFFFVVPVVSTTLASFDRLFAGLGPGDIGWLLLDEAGQATPQSAAGSLWRSRRAIILGDPLQIEPVFSSPPALVSHLLERNEVSPLWSPLLESVQTLADRQTHYGAWVGRGENRVWTGMPLRTHRRCEDPMFSIANQISYAGQMVQGKVDGQGQPIRTTEGFPLGESAWFDVRSQRVDHPVCEDELRFLDRCLRQILSAGTGQKVFVISPFRKVAVAAWRRFQRKEFPGVSCGTVHTFQGKEAPTVFLLLGTAPGAAGSGARQWAASRPNLLNVAVTRAKNRLYVIGDHSQWSTLPHFAELATALTIVQSSDFVFS